MFLTSLRTSPPARVDVCAEPFVQLRRIFAVRVGPRNRGVVARVREVLIEPPEAAYESLGVARHRLREVSAGRRDGAYYADASVLAAYRDDVAGAFVEFGEAARQVGGEALFRRNFFEAPGELAQRLRPARRGIGHDRHVVAHVAEVFRERDARVN